MHELGLLKYGVELEDFHFTVDTLDQGFDFRNTIQHLDSFCEKYSYNIAKQVCTKIDCIQLARFSDHSLCCVLRLIA
jgi:hypothetical protein